MAEPRLFLCGGAKLTGKDGRGGKRSPIYLSSHGAAQNVKIRIEDVAKVFAKHLSPRLVDLLEIAAYVFAGDSAAPRGKGWEDRNRSTSESWGRSIRFIIAVREPDFWGAPGVVQLLREIVCFLSDDDVAFEFQRLTKDRQRQEYLEFGTDEDWPFYRAERVLMFSGGLDSLAGALEAARSGQSLVLVSHRSVSVMDSRQRRLYDELRKTVGAPMTRVPVWSNKTEALGREYTQRTRSLLYAALGLAVAQSVKAGGVRFFENGVVSLNLPIADEVLRARASRTTHPLALHLLGRLGTLIVGRPIVIDNPYLFHTKREVVEQIVQAGGSRLIPLTCSCSHTGRHQSKTQWHCGACSQCIDRRIAIVAAGACQFDEQTDYESDVFVGERKDGRDKNMAVGYARHAFELARMSEGEIAAEFNLEFGRAVRSLDKQRDAAQRLVETHQRHAACVTKILCEQLSEHMPRLLAGSLPESCMLNLIAGRKHLESTWKRYADRISEYLRLGVPVTCKTHKPKDEKHLQEFCDGILKATTSTLSVSSRSCDGHRP
jgi:7-cyano-7-deazaguanine synthase in queuosine biosynthesis